MLNGWTELTLTVIYFITGVKKRSSQQHVNFGKKAINVAYMGFGALKQHSEKKIHIGFTTHLEEGKQTGSVKKVTIEGHETVISQPGEQKGKQTVLQEFFTKKSVDPGDHAVESTCQPRNI